MSVKKKIEEAAWPSLASILVLFPVVECNADVDLWKTTALKKIKHQQQKKKPLIIQLHNAWLWASRTRSWIYRGWEKSLRLLYMHVKRWRFNEQEAFKRSNRFLLELTFPFYTMHTKALDYQFKNKNNPQARDYTMDTRLLFYCSCLIWSSASW